MYWVAVIGEEVDAPMGHYDTPEAAIRRCDELFASATPSSSPFSFWAYDPKQLPDILYLTEEVMPIGSA